MLPNGQNSDLEIKYLNKYIITQNKKKLTDHAAAEEQGLDQPNPELVTTDQTPLSDGGATRTSDPLPRTRFQFTHAFGRGVTTRAGRSTQASPVGFTVRKDHDHGMKSL